MTPPPLRAGSSHREGTRLDDVSLSMHWHPSSAMATVVPFDTFVFLVWRVAVVTLGAVRQGRKASTASAALPATPEVQSPWWQVCVCVCVCVCVQVLVPGRAGMTCCCAAALLYCCRDAGAWSSVRKRFVVAWPMHTGVTTSVFVLHWPGCARTQRPHDDLVVCCERFAVFSMRVQRASAYPIRARVSASVKAIVTAVKERGTAPRLRRSLKISVAISIASILGLVPSLRAQFTFSSWAAVRAGFTQRVACASHPHRCRNAATLRHRYRVLLHGWRGRRRSRSLLTTESGRRRSRRSFDCKAP